MKKITLLVVVVFAMIIVAACEASAPAVTEVPVSQPVATEPAIQPAATEPVAGTNSTEVEVTLGDNTIDSSLTTFQVGVPYTFIITNKGNHAHNFNIAQPISVAGSLDSALQNALLAVPKDQLGGGAQVTVQYTFPDSTAAAQLEFSCLIQRHYNDGMKLAITVTK
ncbi:MAG: hypothetical protein NTW69_03160 [Chloroflexi bacterium]|nr:hypothetical protein [Chloroflexota bacterium]